MPDGYLDLISNLQAGMSELTKKVVILEERSNHQSQNLQQMSQVLDRLSDEIGNRLPYSITIAISVLTCVIGVLGTLAVGFLH